MNSSQRKTTCIIFIILCFLSTTGNTQSLTNIPPNEPNTRFGSQDIFDSKIVRPALSVRGFDSSTLPGGANFGLGMKQILEKLIADDPSVVDVTDELNNTNDIVGQADKDLVTPSGTLKDKREDLQKNSRITQSRAFMALATNILENNGYTPQQTEDMFGESHSQALQELKNALLNPPGGNHMALDLVTDDSWNQSENALNIAANFNDLDPVKLGTSLTNMARAIDLYLALENAYIHYGDNESFLLSQQERGDLLEHFGMNLKAFYKFNKLEIGAN